VARAKSEGGDGDGCRRCMWPYARTPEDRSDDAMMRATGAAILDTHVGSYQVLVWCHLYCVLRICDAHPLLTSQEGVDQRGEMMWGGVCMCTHRWHLSMKGCRRSVASALVRSARAATGGETAPSTFRDGRQRRAGAGMCGRGLRATCRPVYCVN
jgi:hypothetical protein